MTLAVQVRQTRFAFDLLGLPESSPVDQSLDTFQDDLERFRATVSGALRADKEGILDVLASRQQDLQEVLDRFIEAEGRSCQQLIGQELPIQEAPRRASFCKIVAQTQWSPDAWDRARPHVNEIWDRYFRLAGPEFRTILDDVRAAAERPADELRRAARLMRDTVLAHHVADLADRIEQREAVRLGRYLDEVHPADPQTARFLLSTFGTDPDLRDLRVDQDAKEPDIFVAKVTDPVVLQALDRFCVGDTRGRYSYRVYRFGADVAVLYDGWLIARYGSLLREISEGTILKNTHRARVELSLNRTAEIRTALVLRCTFTTGARLDDSFMDFMRGLDGKKIGPNTWDIPCRDSLGMDALKTTLKTDWGYPYIYESIENPSKLYDLYDTSSDGKTRFSNFVRYVTFDATARPVLERHAGRDTWVLRSQDPASTWSGGWFETREAAEARVAAVLGTQRTCEVEKLEELQIGLRRAATKVVNQSIASALDDLADDVTVAAHWFCGAEPVVDRTIQAYLDCPALGTRLRIGNATYVVGAARDGLAWFDVRDAKGDVRVVMKPDLLGHVAVVATFDEGSVKPSIGPVTAVNVQATGLFEVPNIVVLVEPGVPGGTVLDGDKLGNSPMGGTENWSPYFPSGFSPTSWQGGPLGGPHVLYYPTPFHGLQPTWDDQHYRNVPTDRKQEQPTQQLTLSPNQRGPSLYNDESESLIPNLTVEKGPHPPDSFNTGLQPGESLDRPLPYDPFLIVAPPRG